MEHQNLSRTLWLALAYLGIHSQYPQQRVSVPIVVDYTHAIEQVDYVDCIF